MIPTFLPEARDPSGGARWRRADRAPRGAAARGPQAVALALIGLLAIIGSPTTEAATVVPPALEWDAASPGPDPAGDWDGRVGGASFTVSGATHDASDPSGYVGIDARYVFDGSGGLYRGSFAGLLGDPTQRPTSIELWFRPLDLLGGQQVLFETGGNTRGLSLTLDDDALLFRVKDGGASISLRHTLAAADLGGFLQLVAVLDLGGDAVLYLDTVEVGRTSAAAVSDWAGGNGSGLGQRRNQVGGNTGDLGGFGNFTGDIALLRFYENDALTAAEVRQNFIATPEPGTGVLVAIGLALVARSRRPARRRHDR